VQCVAFHARHELDYAIVANILNQTIDDCVAKLAVRHLTALEAQRRLHLVAVLQKAYRLVFARDVIVIIDGHREFNFLNGDDFLTLTRSAIRLFLFIQELSVVLNATNGRNGSRRDFHEVEAAFAGDLQGFEGWEDAELLAFFVNDANFAGANSLIDTDKLFRGTLIDGCISSRVGQTRSNSVYQPGQMRR
jgi:hypothetical protein